MRSRLQRPPVPRLRSGLTVVEVLAALVVVSVGLLGMAGASALSFRAAIAAGRERRVVERLGLRLAALSAAGCQRAAGGAEDDAADGVRERWVVAPPTGGASLVEAGAEWAVDGRPRSVVLRSALLC
jgi:Tfp pilus assembly protein PilV